MAHLDFYVLRYVLLWFDQSTSLEWGTSAALYHVFEGSSWRGLTTISCPTRLTLPGHARVPRCIACPKQFFCPLVCCLHGGCHVDQMSPADFGVRHGEETRPEIFTLESLFSGRGVLLPSTYVLF